MKRKEKNQFLLGSSQCSPFQVDLHADSPLVYDCLCLCLELVPQGLTDRIHSARHRCAMAFPVLTSSFHLDPDPCKDETWDILNLPVAVSGAIGRESYYCTLFFHSFLY